MSGLTSDDQFYYHALLGQIIDRFAVVEGVLNNLLVHESGVSAPVGKAIFSGVRIEQAMSYCRRIWDAKSEARPSYLEYSFAQLALLNGARNDLVHYGAAFEGWGSPLIVTNERAAHTISGIRRRYLHSDMLHAIFNDMSPIILAIEHRFRPADGGYFGPGVPFDPENFAPWQYKQP